MFQIFLPMGMMSISAAMQVTVTMRNIRSRRLMRWSLIISNHFLITQSYIPFNTVFRTGRGLLQDAGNPAAQLGVGLQQGGVAFPDEVPVASFPGQLQLLCLGGELLGPNGERGAF